MESIETLGEHKGLLITHLIIRSLWIMIDLVRTTFDKSEIDLITFSETWLTNEIPNEFIDFEGYNVHRNDSGWYENEVIISMCPPLIFN